MSKKQSYSTANSTVVHCVLSPQTKVSKYIKPVTKNRLVRALDKSLSLE